MNGSSSDQASSDSSNVKASAADGDTQLVAVGGEAEQQQLLSKKESMASSLAAIEEKKQQKIRAAIKIQAQIRRRFVAHARVKKRFFLVYQRVWDPKFRIYFWYNRLLKAPQWNRPVPKITPVFSPADVEAGRKIQRIICGFIGKMRGRRAAHERFTRYYDPNQNRFYWQDNKTEATTWTVTKWLDKQEVPMPNEDKMLYQSYLKIKELEEKLKAKDEEIKQVRQMRFEELEPEVLRDKVSDARALRRSKHMDEWSMERLCSWFEELKMGEHVPYLLKNRVDGLLLINLADADWTEIGIVAKIQIKKLQLIMKAYRTRYARKVAGRYNEDDDDLSDYAPSDLSDIIGEDSDEGSDFDDDDDSGEDGDHQDDNSQGSFEEEDLTEEEKREREMDSKNMHMETIVAGDEVNYPLTGDVVRVRYTCTLVANEKVVGATKTQMSKASVEFALGYGQVIKGFERALPKMSLGERAKIILSPEYAYGREGLFPNIPPDAEICFDLTLLGFKVRAVWIKPLVQEPGLCQKPYVEGANESEDAFVKPDDDVM